MFFLVEMKDTVRIPPWKFQKSLKDAVADELRLKFANKVRLSLLYFIIHFDFNV